MVWLYALVSVFIVSLISLVGVFTLSISREKLEKILIYLVSLSTGTLLGDAFIHLIPEAFANNQGKIFVPLCILSGILTFFILEKFLHWRHCHHLASEDHPHHFSYTILAGDSFHNFIDGMIIAGSYFISVPVGIATTVAVVLHEIPQELGDFGSLVYGGFTRAKAIFFNFASGLTAVIGAIVVLIFNSGLSGITAFLIPFAAGGFIYIASADLIPELHKETEPRKSLGQLLTFIIGISIMFGLLFLE